MKTNNFRSHTTLFRVACTFVFVLLLLTAVSSSYAAEDNVFTSLINQLNSFFFGAPVSSSTTSDQTTIAPGDATSTCSMGVDPTPDPPPPPPPPKPE